MSNKLNNRRYYLHRKIKEKAKNIRVDARAKTISVPAKTFQDGLPFSLDVYAQKLSKLGYSIQSYII